MEACTCQLVSNSSHCGNFHCRGPDDANQIHLNISTPLGEPAEVAAYQVLPAPVVNLVLNTPVGKTHS